MIQIFQQYINKRKNNLNFLRRIADETGREIETWTYEKLSRPAEELSFSRQIEGTLVFFSFEAYETNKNGDIHVCMDVDAKIPTFPYVKLPSYVFWKCRDGSVYY